MAFSKWQLAIAMSIGCAVIVAPSAEASTYVVQSGDSLYKIAQKFNTTIDQLKKWNKLSTDKLYVNQTLIVVAPGEQNNIKPNENESPASISSKLKTYKVVSGDTLSKIASRNNTTVTKLKEWNGLQSDLIKVGQVLIVQKQSSINSVALGTAGTTNNPTNNGGNTSSNISGDDAVDAMIKKQLSSEKMITSNPSVSSLAKYEQLLKLSKTFIGVPYVFGGNTPAGFDCSGFISYVYNKVGITNQRRTSLDYFLKDTTVVKNPVPGDIVFFKNTYIATISHMGIYIGNGEMIHAGSKGIEITKLSYKYWDDRFVAFKRFNIVK